MSGAKLPERLQRGFGRVRNASVYADDKDGVYLGTLNSAEFAAKVVARYNAHAALVEALAALVEREERDHSPACGVEGCEICPEIEAGRAALRAAEGGKP